MTDIFEGNRVFCVISVLHLSVCTQIRVAVARSCRHDHSLHAEIGRAAEATGNGEPCCVQSLFLEWAVCTLRRMDLHLTIGLLTVRFRCCLLLCRPPSRSAIRHWRSNSVRASKSSSATLCSTRACICEQCRPILLTNGLPTCVHHTSLHTPSTPIHTPDEPHSRSITRPRNGIDAPTRGRLPPPLRCRYCRCELHWTRPERAP